MPFESTEGSGPSGTLFLAAPAAGPFAPVVLAVGAILKLTSLLPSWKPNPLYSSFQQNPTIDSAKALREVAINDIAMFQQLSRNPSKAGLQTHWYDSEINGVKEVVVQVDRYLANNRPSVQVQNAQPVTSTIVKSQESIKMPLESSIDPELYEDKPLGSTPINQPSLWAGINPVGPLPVVDGGRLPVTNYFLSNDALQPSGTDQQAAQQEKTPWWVSQGVLAGVLLLILLLILIAFPRR